MRLMDSIQDTASLYPLPRLPSGLLLLFTKLPYEPHLSRYATKVIGSKKVLYKLIKSTYKFYGKFGQVLW